MGEIIRKTSDNGDFIVWIDSQPERDLVSVDKLSLTAGVGDGS